MVSTLLEENVIQPPLPVCLFENLYGLVSLLAVLQFNAQHFIGISDTLGQIKMDLKCGNLPQPKSFEMLSSQIALLKKHCTALGLKFTLDHIERFEASRGATRQHLLNTLSEITQRLWDELGAKTILMISEVESKYFEDSQFPVVVFDKFPQVSFDATEAGKCLAMSRPTACVFHLMRVTEYGLHEIGKTLGMKEEKPNWEPIILKIDAELRKPYKEREHKGLRDFLANVSVHMNAVKVAWRNRVMHVDKKHTPEEAIEIYSATCGLMRYISENLPTPEKKTALSVIRGMIKG